MTEKLKLLWASSTVFKCTNCHTWVVRSPDFMGDSEVEGFECEKCGTTSVNLSKGRPFGPKSNKWKEVVFLWEEYYDFNIEMIDAFGDYSIVKTKPPLTKEYAQKLYWSKNVNYDGNI